MLSHPIRLSCTSLRGAYSSRDSRLVMSSREGLRNIGSGEVASLDPNRLLRRLSAAMTARRREVAITAVPGFCRARAPRDESPPNAALSGRRPRKRRGKRTASVSRDRALALARVSAAPAWVKRALVTKWPNASKPRRRTLAACDSFIERRFRMLSQVRSRDARLLAGSLDFIHDRVRARVTTTLHQPQNRRHFSCSVTLRKASAAMKHPQTLAEPVGSRAFLVTRV
jgi:hypothetical protein